MQRDIVKFKDNPSGLMLGLKLSSGFQNPGTYDIDKFVGTMHIYDNYLQIKPTGFLYSKRFVGSVRLFFYNLYFEFIICYSGGLLDKILDPGSSKSYLYFLHDSSVSYFVKKI